MSYQEDSLDKYAGLSEYHKLMALGYEEMGEFNLDFANSMIEIDNEALHIGDKYLEALD